MSVETRLHLISPEFAEANARAPELMTRWTGRSEPGGIDPAAFVAHPKVIELAGALRVPHVASWDDGTSLGPWLEGIASRNTRSRFKGYRTFRLVAAELEDKAAAIAGPVIIEHAVKGLS